MTITVLTHKFCY